jgi:hypothetical protein
MDALFVAATMARRGLLTPARPDRVVRQFAALGRWGGFGLAGEKRVDELIAAPLFHTRDYAGIQIALA